MERVAYPGVWIIFNSTAKSSAVSVTVIRGHPPGTGAWSSAERERISRSFGEENEIVVE
jgi:hypothetical protein